MMQPRTVFDIHAHVISTDAHRYPIAPIGGRQSDWSRDRPVGVEEFNKELDAAGIAKAALVQASTCYGHDSRYVADCLIDFPDRFVGVFSCDVLSPNAVESIDYWLSKGFSGMRVFTTGSTMPGQQDWLDDSRTFDAWARAEQAKLPVCLQMTAAGIPQLKNLLDRFCDLRVILDHMARPLYEDGMPYSGANSLWELAGYPNVYVKITERNFLGASTGRATPESFFGHLLSVFGPERLAWGSNFPASKRTLAELVQLAETTLSFVPDEDLEWVFYRTAQLLYPSLTRGGE